MIISQFLQRTKAGARRACFAALALFSSANLLSGQSSPAARSLLLDAAWVDHSEELIAVGERGATLRCAGSEDNWQLTPSGIISTINCISFAPLSRKGWAAGHDAVIITTDDGGKTWSRCYQGDQADSVFLDILALDAKRVIAVGAYGLALVSNDGGSTWRTIKVIDEDQHLNRITRGQDGRLYIAGERGTLLTSTDDGLTWTKVQSPYEGSFFGVLPIGDGNILVFGLRGSIFRNKADFSGSWERIPSGTTSLLSTALKLKNGFIVLAGQARTFLVSRDSGKSFTLWSPGLTTAVSKLVQTQDGTLLAFGEAGVSTLPAP